MNNDKNDVALDQAPATVDGKKVLAVTQVSISDIPAEDSYKTVLADGSIAAVPVSDFTPGADVTTAPITDQATAGESDVAAAMEAAPDPTPADSGTGPAPAPVAPAADATPAPDQTNTPGEAQ